jgi:intracellular multiplication protein IcmK
VGEYGPYAIAPLVETSGTTSLAAGSSTLAAVLEGVAPSGSERLTVNGVDGRTTAYSLAGVTYVRTPLTLLSPAWSSSISSADGMNVYTLKNAPVLLLSDKGQVVRARLNEKEATYDQ